MLGLGWGFGGVWACGPNGDVQLGGLAAGKRWLAWPGSVCQAAGAENVLLPWCNLQAPGWNHCWPNTQAMRHRVTRCDSPAGTLCIRGRNSLSLSAADPGIWVLLLQLARKRTINQVGSVGQLGCWAGGWLGALLGARHQRCGYFQ